MTNFRFWNDFFKCRRNLLDKFGKKYQVSGRTWNEYSGPIRDKYFETIPNFSNIFIISYWGISHFLPPKEISFYRLIQFWVEKIPTSLLSFSFKRSGEYVKGCYRRKEIARELCQQKDEFFCDWHKCSRQYLYIQYP